MFSLQLDALICKWTEAMSTSKTILLPTLWESFDHVSVCCGCSVTQSCLTLWDPTMHGASLPFTISWSLLKLMFIELLMPSNHLILCHPLLLLPSIFLSIRVFSNESAHCIRWPQYWSYSIRPPSEYSELLSFRVDWLDLLAIQGTLKSSPTPQFKNINSSAFRFLYSPALTSIHDYWKNHSFDFTDLYGKVMSLLFNMLSSFVIAFLPRSKHLLISCLQSLSAMILEPTKIKPVTVSFVSLSICYDTATKILVCECHSIIIHNSHKVEKITYTSTQWINFSNMMLSERY